jgi:hypothetical protein
LQDLQLILLPPGGLRGEKWCLHLIDGSSAVQHTTISPFQGYHKSQ